MNAILKNIKNGINRSLFEIDFTIDNMVSIEDKNAIKMYDDFYAYYCYRVGNIISVSKGGRFFYNSGCHGVFEVDLLSGEISKTSFSHQYYHVKSMLEN